MAHTVVKPPFRRGDRTSISVYRADLPIIEQAMQALQRDNPSVRVAAPDAMRVLLREGWRAMGGQP